MPGSVPDDHVLTTLFKATHSIITPAIQEVIVIRYNDKSVWTAPKKRYTRRTPDWYYARTHAEAINWLISRNADAVKVQEQAIQTCLVRIKYLEKARQAIERLAVP